MICLGIPSDVIRRDSPPVISLGIPSGDTLRDPSGDILRDPSDEILRVTLRQGFPPMFYLGILGGLPAQR